MDALYAKFSVLNEIISQNKITVIRVKQQDYNIIRDAEGLFLKLKPEKSPILLKIEETRVSYKDQVLGKPVITHLVTNAKRETVPTETLWRIMHRRWDIENKVFHDLKTFWKFEHNYHHDEEAFMVMRWLMTVIAMNLVLLFYQHRLPASFAKRNSLQSLIYAILLAFLDVERGLRDPG